MSRTDYVSLGARTIGPWLVWAVLWSLPAAASGKPRSSLLKTTLVFDERSTEGAWVFVDGKVVGQTPGEIEVWSGKGTLVVEKEGFGRFERDYVFGGGEEFVVVAELVALEEALERQDGHFGLGVFGIGAGIGLIVLGIQVKENAPVGLEGASEKIGGLIIGLAGAGAVAGGIGLIFAARNALLEEPRWLDRVPVDNRTPAEPPAAAGLPPLRGPSFVLTGRF